MTLSSQPVLVLGAKSDIARALAAEFAAKGHPIMLAGRKPDELERNATDLNIRHGVEASTHAFDALDLAGHGAFLDALPLKPGIVICAVGLLGDQEADAEDPDAAARIITTNLTGPALLLEAAAKRLAAQSEPTLLIGISSVAGDRGRAKNYIYGSAKAGFTAYLSGLRQKYATSALHVMTVKPGFVRTAMTEGMDLPGPLTSSPEGFAKNIMKAIIRKRRVYYDLKWWILMTVIRAVPERIFMGMKF